MAFKKASHMSINYAELVLGAETSGLLRAKADLSSVTRAGTQTEQGVKRAMSGVETAVKKVPMAAEEAARGFDDLRTSLDPLYAASKRYEAASMQAAAAVKSGAATQAQANSVLDLAEARYLGVGKAANTSNAAVKAATGGMSSFAFQSRMAAMQLSQVAQQTAAGGGFIRALAIQLPDLALGFGAVGIAAGVAAGVLLPMAANFITGADNAEELDDALDSLAQTSREYIEINKTTKQSVSALALEFGGFSAEIQRTYEILQGVAFERTLDSLGVAIAALDVSRLEFLVGVFQQGQGEIEAFNQNYNDALAEIKESFGLTGSQAEEFLGQLNALKTADGPDEIVRAADQLNAFLIESYGSARKIPPELRDMVQRLGEAQTVAARVAANVDGSADSANAAATAAANLSGQLSVAAQYAGQLAANLAMAPAGIQAFQDQAAQLTAQISALDAGYSQITASAAGYRKELEQKYGLADAANAAEEAYISGVINRQVKEYTNVQELSKAYSDKVTALNKVRTSGAAAGASTAKGMKAAAKEAEKLADEIERLELDADPLKKYNAELANLDALVANGLSDGAYRKAVAELNDEFANSDPMISKAGDAIGDFVAGGMRDFGDLLGAFKDMLKEMIATAIANPIKLALLGAGGGLAGTAAQAAGIGPGGGIIGSLGSGGGLLGSIGGSIGALTSGLGAGFNMALGGMTSGGLTGLGSVLSTQLGAATASVGAFGAALGAIALPLAGVAAVFSFFKKSVKELDSGLRITVEGMDALVESFRKTETKRFWGLSKRVRTSYTALEAEAAAPIISTIEGLANSVVEMGDVFGFAASNIDRASVSLKISTKGLSDAEIEEAISGEMNRLADVFADSIVGTFDEVVTEMVSHQTPIMKLFNISGLITEVTSTVERVNEEFEALKKEGEGSYDALSRLVNSLNGMNAIFDTLGLTMYQVTLAGADMASSLVDLFGDLETANTATTAYYQAFYSEGERISTLTRQLTTAFEGLGETMPETRGQFRALVEAQDLTTQAGRRMFASLVGMSAQLDAVLPAIDSLANKMGALVAGAVNDALAPIDAQIESSNSAATQARQSAAEFYRLADSLRSAAGGITGVSTATDLMSAQQAFSQTFAKAIKGDVDSLGALGGSGQALARDSADFASSAVELRKVQSGISKQLNQAAAVSEALGLGADYQALLFDVQTAALEETRALLEQGDFTQELLRQQTVVLENIGILISNSASMQIAAGKNAAGNTVAALVDNAGTVIGALSSEGSRHITALQAQTTVLQAAAITQSADITRALDANADGIVTSQEATRAATLSTYQSTVISLASAIDRNGSMTTAQIRASLAGKASDSAISAVINAVDQNRNGVVTAQEIAAAKTLSGINHGSLQQVQALLNQNAAFSNAITGQTGSITGSQSLTNAELGKMQDLQGETVSITELVERAVAGNENLTSALLNRMAAGISVAGVPSMVSGLNSIGSLIGRIVSVQEASLAAAEAEAARQAALTNAQRELEATALAQGSAIEQVSAASAEILSLASRFGVYLNAQSGAVQMSQTAKFGVNAQGLFDAQYNQISYSGSASKATNFKSEFYGDGGLYGQTYGRAAELKSLAEQLQAQRQAVIDLGGIPQFARGGLHYGGARIVGENGPELELTGPSRIFNANQTKNILGSGADQSSEIRELQKEFAELRRLLLEVVKNTKRTSDIARKHDVDGMPPVRA